MTLTVTQLSAVDYDLRLKKFLRMVEGEESLPYVDFNSTGKRANPTIAKGVRVI